MLCLTYVIGRTCDIRSLIHQMRQNQHMTWSESTIVSIFCCPLTNSTDLRLRHAIEHTQDPNQFHAHVKTTSTTTRTNHQNNDQKTSSRTNHSTFDLHRTLREANKRMASFRSQQRALSRYGGLPPGTPVPNYQHLLTGPR